MSERERSKRVHEFGNSEVRHARLSDGCRVTTPTTPHTNSLTHTRARTRVCRLNSPNIRKLAPEGRIVQSSCTQNRTRLQWRLPNSRRAIYIAWRVSTTPPPLLRPPRSTFCEAHLVSSKHAECFDMTETAQGQHTLDGVCMRSPGQFGSVSLPTKPLGS